MELTPPYLLVLCVACAGILAPIAVVIAGLYVERQPMADRIVYGGFITSVLGAMALFLLDDQSVQQTGVNPRIGLLFGLVWAGSLLAVFLPSVLLVGRRRVARGWTRALDGRTTPTEQA